MSIPSSRDQVSQIIGELSGKVSSTPGLDADNWQEAKFLGHTVFVHKGASHVVDGAIQNSEIVSRLTSLVKSDRFGGGDNSVIGPQEVVLAPFHTYKEEAGSLAGDFLQKHLTGYQALSPKEALPSKQPKKGGYDKAPTRAELGRKRRADMRNPMGVRKPTGSTRSRHLKRSRKEPQLSTAQIKRASYTRGCDEGVESEQKRARPATEKKVPITRDVIIDVHTLVQEKKAIFEQGAKSGNKEAARALTSLDNEIQKLQSEGVDLKQSFLKAGERVSGITLGATFAVEGAAYYKVALLSVALLASGGLGIPVVVGLGLGTILAVDGVTGANMLKKIASSVRNFFFSPPVQTFPQPQGDALV